MEDENKASDKYTVLKSAVDWAVWKFQTRIRLLAVEAYSIVTGENPRPTVATGADEAAMTSHRKELKDWEKLEGKAQRVIASHLSRESTMHIMNCESAKSMWDTLYGIYENKSEATVHMVQQQWFLLNRDENDDIATHITKVKDVAHRLKALGETVSDNMIITKIILTLPPNLHHFSVAWESTAVAERTLTQLTSRLMMEEARIKMRETQITSNDSSSTGALAAKGKNNDRKSRKPGKCHYCHKPGHWEYECKKKKRDQSGQSEESTSDRGARGGALITHVLSTLPAADTLSDEWYLDSGASSHMTSTREWFVNLSHLVQPERIIVGDGELILGTGRGDINIMAHDGEKWTEKHLKNVLYAPNLRFNLFSTGAATDKGLIHGADDKTAWFRQNGVNVAIADRCGSMYKMRFKIVKPQLSMTMENVDEQSQKSMVSTKKIWHERLAHQNYQYVENFLRANGIKTVGDREFCEPYAHGKIHRLPHPPSANKTKAIGEIIHADVCGKVEVKSMGRAEYFLLIKDDFSHYRTVYFMKAKSEVTAHFKNFITRTKKETGKSISILRTDQGLEFMNAQMKQLLDDNGVRHQKSVTYTPEQNGKIERENRTIVEAARTMLQDSSLPHYLWAEAINTAVYVINRTGTSSIPNKTPYELWTERKYDPKQLKKFGCEVFVHIPKQRRHGKFQSRALRGHLVGYDEDVKGYRVWLPELKKVEIHHDVVFNESKTFEKKNTRPVSWGWPSEDETADDDNPDSDDNSRHTAPTPVLDAEHSTPASVQNARNHEEIHGVESPEHSTESQTPRSAEIIEISDSSSAGSSDSFKTVFRPTFTDAELNEIVRNLNQPGDDDMTDDTGERERETSLIVQRVADQQEPTSYHEAVNCPDAVKWKRAIEEELLALHKNKTWRLVERPAHANVLRNRWVFKVKQKPDGSIDRYKARVVVKGFQQVKGVDYNETYSPVARMESVRMCLTLMASRNMHGVQFDIKTAFLYGKLKEKVLMEQPEGHDDGTGRICELLKSLYGLKQSARCWNEDFTDELEANGLKATDTDPCVFISEDGELILVIHVDDGLVISKNLARIEQLMRRLKNRFEIKVSKLNMFLGIQIEKLDDGSLLAHQSLYAKRILNRFQVDGANASTPDPTCRTNISPDGSFELSKNMQLQKTIIIHEISNKWKNKERSLIQELRTLGKK